MVSVNEISVALKALWSWPELVQKSSVEGHDGSYSNTSKPFKTLGSHFLNVFCGVLIPSIFGALQLFFCACDLQFCELPHVATLKHKAQSAHGGSRMLMVLRLLNLEGVFVLEDLRRTINHSPKEGGVAFYDEL